MNIPVWQAPFPSAKGALERVAFNQVHLIERNSQHYQRLACLGLHSI